MPVAKRRTVEQKKLKGGCCSDEHSHRLQVLTSAAKMARAGISYPFYCLQLTAVLGTVTKGIFQPLCPNCTLPLKGLYCRFQTVANTPFYVFCDSLLIHSKKLWVSLFGTLFLPVLLCFFHSFPSPPSFPPTSL